MNNVYVVIDMQNDFVTGSLGSEEARRIVPNVVKHIEEIKKDDIVVLTQDTHYENYMDTLEGKNLPVQHCMFLTKGWEIIPEVISALAKCPCNKKHIHIDQKETFGDDDLEYRIYNLADEAGIDIKGCDTHIYIMGLCTDICVISNALYLRMQFPNTKIFCFADACAGVTPEKHKAALEVMKSCQIEILNEGEN